MSVTLCLLQIYRRVVSFDVHKVANFVIEVIIYIFCIVWIWLWWTRLAQWLYWQGYLLEDLEFSSHHGQQSVQSGSWAYIAPCSVCTGGSFILFISLCYCTQTRTQLTLNHSGMLCPVHLAISTLYKYLYYNYFDSLVLKFLTLMCSCKKQHSCYKYCVRVCEITNVSWLQDVTWLLHYTHCVLCIVVMAWCESWNVQLCSSINCIWQFIGLGVVGFLLWGKVAIMWN
jgi:hypothetical protein